MDMINDQENIRRLQKVDNRTRMILKTGPDAREDEWKQIRLEMEAGSTNINPRRAVPLKNNYFEDKSSLASILHLLEKELQSQGDAVAEYEKQDWQDEGEWIAQGWCEGLEFAIKTIKRHNGSPIQSETNQ